MDTLPPIDLVLDIANLPIAGAHTLDLHRGGPKGKIVNRLQLTVDEAPTPHGTHPDMSDDAIAEHVWSAAVKDCEAQKREHCRFTVRASYSKGRGGPTPEPRTFDLTVGDPQAASEKEQRLDLISELRSERKVMFEQVVACSGAIAKLAAAFTGMVTSVADAIGHLAQREREASEIRGGDALASKMLDHEHEGERERMRLFQTVAVPLLAKIGAAPALASGSESEGTASMASDAPEIVKLCRKLGESLTSEQLEGAARIFGSNRLSELRSVSHEGEAYTLCAWLYGQPGERIIAVWNSLSDDQVPVALALQQLAAATPAAKV